MRDRLSQADPRLMTILMIVFVQFVGASMALPILPLLAKREFDLTPETITPLLSSFFAAQFLAGPFIGWLSDRYGRVPVLILSQVGTVVSFLMLVFAQSIPMLYASRILDGVTGGNVVVAQAYITDITPRERRTQALGMLFAAFGVGFIIGPAVGGILSSFFGPRIPFLFASIAAAWVVWLTIRNLNETLTPEQRAMNRTSGKVGLSPVTVLSNLPMMTILIIGFIVQMGLGMLQATFSLFGENVLFVGYSQRVTDLGIGLLLSTVGVGQVITQLFLLRRMVERFGEGWLVVFGNITRVISLSLLATVVMPLWGAPPLLLFAIGSGLLVPSLQTMLTYTVDDRYRGSALGLFQSVASFATIFSTFYGGRIFAQDPRLPFIIGAGLNFAVILPTLWLVWWVRKQKAREALMEPVSAEVVSDATPESVT
jgi:DHA1 family tetracycline resistance protein-like MFS transporter